MSPKKQPHVYSLFPADKQFAHVEEGYKPSGGQKLHPAKEAEQYLQGPRGRMGVSEHGPSPGVPTEVIASFEQQGFSRDAQVLFIAHACHLRHLGHYGRTRKQRDGQIPYESHPHEVQELIARHGLDAIAVAQGGVHDLGEESLEELLRLGGLGKRLGQSKLRFFYDAFNLGLAASFLEMYRRAEVDPTDETLHAIQSLVIGHDTLCRPVVKRSRRSDGSLTRLIKQEYPSYLADVFYPDVLEQKRRWSRFGEGYSLKGFYDQARKFFHIPPHRSGHAYAIFEDAMLLLRVERTEEESRKDNAREIAVKGLDGLANGRDTEWFSEHQRETHLCKQLTITNELFNLGNKVRFPTRYAGEHTTSLTLADYLPILRVAISSALGGLALTTQVAANLQSRLPSEVVGRIEKSWEEYERSGFAYEMSKVQEDRSEWAGTIGRMILRYTKQIPLADPGDTEQLYRDAKALRHMFEKLAPNAKLWVGDTEHPYTIVEGMRLSNLDKRLKQILEESIDRGAKRQQSR